MKNNLILDIVLYDCIEKKQAKKKMKIDLYFVTAPKMNVQKTFGFLGNPKHLEVKSKHYMTFYLGEFQKDLDWRMRFVDILNDNTDMIHLLSTQGSIKWRIRGDERQIKQALTKIQQNLNSEKGVNTPMDLLE